MSIDRLRGFGLRPAPNGRITWAGPSLKALIGALLAIAWATSNARSRPMGEVQKGKSQQAVPTQEMEKDRTQPILEDEDTESDETSEQLTELGGHSQLDEVLNKVLIQPNRPPAWELASLWRRQALQLRHRGFRAQARRLLEAARLCERDQPSTVAELHGLIEQAACVDPGRRRLAEQAVCLDRQAEALYHQGRHAAAKTSAEQALEIREKIYPSIRYPKGNLFLARSLYIVGKLLGELGEYDIGLDHLERSRDMLEKHCAEGHPNLANALIELSRLTRESGDFSKALAHGQRAVTMCEALYPARDFPKGHLQLAQSLNRMSDILRVYGDLPKALAYSRRGLAICEALYPRDQYPKGHFELAMSLSNLSMTLIAHGEFQTAMPYLRRQLALCEALYPKGKYPQGHPLVAVSLSHLGTAFIAQGEFHKALPYLQSALAAIETIYRSDRYPRGHPLLIDALDHLADAVRFLEGSESALPFFRRALTVSEVLYPKDRYPRGHPQLVRSLSKLGASLAGRGQYLQALPYLRRALAATEVLYSRDRYPKGHPQLTQALIYLGNALYLSGEHDSGLPHLQRALAACEALYPQEQYPNGHPVLSFCLRSLGALHHSRGEHQKALPYLEQCSAMDQTLTANFATASSEAEALNFAANLPLARDLLLSTPEDADLSADSLYSHIWRGKSAIARILLRRQQAVAEDASAAAQEIWQELMVTRRNLSQLLLAPAGQHNDRLRQLRELTNHKEDLERRLGQTLPEFGRRLTADLLPHSKLVEKLPAATVFVDLLRYSRIEPGWQSHGRTKLQITPSYVAFLLRPGRPVLRVDLGRAEPIDTAVAEWRRDIADQRPSAAADRLSQILWAPLAGRLPSSTRTLLLAPDGDLMRLPWVALPSGPGGRVVLEDYVIALVPHGPFLLDCLTAPLPVKDSGHLLVVGGVRYDEPADTEAHGKKPRWRYLPRTLQEAAKVIELGGQRSVQSLLGSEAGTERLLAELPKGRWAHLATHGFFADSAVRSVLQVDERLYERAHFGKERYTPGARNPMVLSGLVLAGANGIPGNSDGTSAEGILTAESLACLPLQNLELVVLSACETGLGEVGGGEGVFGLQRAFHLAGAHAVMASLWKVDDMATQALMEEFYRNLWQRGLSKPQALQQAQLVLRRSNEFRPGPVRGPGPDRPIHPEPAARPQLEKAAPTFFWGAWVMSGDPGDLSRILAPEPEEIMDPHASQEEQPVEEPISVFLRASIAGLVVSLGILSAYLAWRRSRPSSRNSSHRGREGRVSE